MKKEIGMIIKTLIVFYLFGVVIMLISQFNEPQDKYEKSKFKKESIDTLRTKL